MNANKALLVNGKTVSSGGDPLSLKEFIQKLPLRSYNAMFTEMGRKNVFYFLKRCLVRFNKDYQRNGTLVYHLANGNEFVLHRGNQLSELVFLEGAYEPLETLIVANLVRAGDVVLDLGANVGYFTALMDRLVKPGGQVHAFEPGQGTFAKLKSTKNLLHLDRSCLHPEAIGDTVGEIDFWSSTSGSDAQQNTAKNEALAQHLRRERVPSTTLDALVSQLPGRGRANIAFVKCDIEGAETAMLKGAASLLNAKNPPIWLVEHNRLALSEQSATSADLLASFAGYDIHFVPICWPPSRMASPRASAWNGKPNDLPDECNLIALPKRGTFAKRAAALQKAGLLAS